VLLTLLIALLMAAPAAANPAPQLVEDWPVGSASPANLAAISGALFFSASDGIHGAELWRAETGTGTGIVLDINSGGGSSPSRAVEFKGDAVFSADDGIHGRELWRSDGTEGGTALVKDITPGPAGSLPSWFTVAGDTLYFTTTDGDLWRSDGTETGTDLVAGARPTALISGTSPLTAVGEIIFFAAYDHGTSDPFCGFCGIRGIELWRSDGTEAGTGVVRDINPGSASSWPVQLTAADGALYFTADDGGRHGRELWRSDGTPLGTKLVKDVLPGPGSGVPPGPSVPVSVGDTLYFVADDGVHGHELWRTDGTEAGTDLVADLHPNAEVPPDYCHLSASTMPLTGLADSVLFHSSQIVGDGAGICVRQHSLWTSDGTASGTTPLASSFQPGTPLRLVRAGDRVYFTAWAENTGYELWESDGTPDGTKLVYDVVPGVDATNPTEITSVGDALYFVGAVDGSATRVGLWRLDTRTSQEPSPDEPVPDGELPQPPLDADPSLGVQPPRPGSGQGGEPSAGLGPSKLPPAEGRLKAGRLIAKGPGRVKGRRVRLVARCVGSSTCVGVARLVRRGKQRGPLLLARGSYKISSGAKRTISLTLSRWGREIMPDRRRLAARIVGARVRDRPIELHLLR
jgi:ELWxxDGT repeat protein